MLKFAQKKGSSIGSLNMQLEFLVNELPAYPSVWRVLKCTQSIREASDAVLTKYERPTDQSDVVKTKRAAYGQKYYDKYAITATPTPERKDGDNMTYNPKTVIDIALAEEGYLEKATNENLDDKTANAGNKNYTKYARDLWAVKFFNSSKVGVAWCAVFVAWSFYVAYGKEAALSLLCQPSTDNCGAGCKSARNYFKAKGQLYDAPQTGDVVYFYSKNKSSISHTGLVYDVDNTYVYTVEGNTSSASGVVANGGAVARKKYRLSYERFAGFGRPNYGMTISDPVKPSASTETTTASYKLGDRTLQKDDKGEDVAALQSSLVLLGFNLGNYGKNKDGVDGSFGTKTDTAVRNFQSSRGLESDGKYGSKTHAAMLEALAKLESETDETSSQQPESIEKERTVTIVCDSGGKVNLRAGDSTAYAGVAQVTPGTVLDYVATSPNGWHGVRCKDRIAWVSPKYAAVTTG